MRIQVTKNTIQGSFWGILGKLLAIIFPFIIRTIIIHKIGNEYAGLSSLFSSILQVLSVADLGFSSAIVYSMYKPVVEDDYTKLSALLNYFRKVYLIIGIVITSVGLILTPFLKYLISGDVPSDINIYILFMFYLLNTASSYLFLGYNSSILSAYQREADNNRITLFVNIVTYAIQIILLLLFKNFYLYVVFIPIGTILINTIRYFYVRKKYPEIKCNGNISIEEKKTINKDVRALFVFKLGGAIVNSLDSVIISIFLGLELVSNYNNYFYIINAITSIIIIIFSALTAGIGNRLITKDTETVRKDFHFILYINGFLVSFCSVCLFSLCQNFICLWVGEEYLFSFLTMCMFVLYFFFHTIRRTVLMYRDAAGIWRLNYIQPIISAIVNVTLNIILVQIIGINGVILSTLISMIFIDFPWESINLAKVILKENGTKYFIEVFYYLLVTCASCTICYFIGNAITITNRWILLIVMGLISAVIGLIMYILLTSFLKINVKSIITFMKNRKKDKVM